MPALRVILAVLCLLGLCLLGAGASAEEYRLQVANLYRDSFAYFIDGPIRTGSAELAMPNRERALDSGEINPGRSSQARPSVRLG
jgi:hypothetical protein